jgi:hypothetical protein
VSHEYSSRIAIKYINENENKAEINLALIKNMTEKYNNLNRMHIFMYNFNMKFNMT